MFRFLGDFLWVGEVLMSDGLNFESLWIVRTGCNCRSREVDTFYHVLLIFLQNDRHMTEAVVQKCSVKKVFFKNFAKFTGKHLCQSLFFDKVTCLRPTTLLKRRLWHRCFPMNSAKFFRTPSFIEHLRWLLLTWPGGNQSPRFTK